MRDTADITGEQAPRLTGPAQVRAPYLHYTGQALGIVFIIVLTACAWLLSVLPLANPTLTAVGLGFGLALFLPGTWLSLAGMPPGKSLLAGGMAFLFLTAVAMLVDAAPGEGVFSFLSHPYGGPAVCFVLLLLFVLIAHRAASPAIAVLLCLLGMHLARAALPLIPPFPRVACLTIVSAALLGWMFRWCAARRSLAFPEISLVLLYAAFALFTGGAIKADNKALTLAVLSLLFVYVLCSVLIVRHSIRCDKALPGFALLNGAAFAAVLWRLASETGAGTQWLAPAVLLAVGAGAVAAVRRHEALAALGAFYLAQALCALIVLCVLYLPAGPALVLVAGLCFAPALFGTRRNGQPYRVAEYGVVSAALVSSFLFELPSQPVLAGPVSVSVHWLYLLGTAAVFAVLGRMHYHWSCRENAGEDFRTEQRLLSLTLLFAAAMLMMLHTILRRNDSESLPLLLSLQGVLFLGAGMLLLMPGLAVIGLVPVMAGHACYHARAFLVPASAGAAEPGQHWQLWVLLAATLLLALVSDWHLGARGPGRPLPAERVLGMLPYLPLLLPLPSILPGNAPPICLAVVLGGLGLIALAGARLAREGLPGLRTLGRAGGLASLCVCLYGLFFMNNAAFVYSGYLPALWAYLVILILLERATAGPAGRPAWICRVLSLGIALLGILGLYQWNPGPVFAVALLGLALMLAVTGYAFRVREYYHAALLLLFTAGAWLLLSITGAGFANTATTAPRLPQG